LKNFVKNYQNSLPLAHPLSGLSAEEVWAVRDEGPDFDDGAGNAAVGELS
jgi:hypothetical protein